MVLVETSQQFLSIYYNLHLLQSETLLMLLLVLLWLLIRCTVTGHVKQRLITWPSGATHVCHFVATFYNNNTVFSDLPGVSLCFIASIKFSSGNVFAGCWILPATKKSVYSFRASRACTHSMKLSESADTAKNVHYYYTLPYVQNTTPFLDFSTICPQYKISLLDHWARK